MIENAKLQAIAQKSSENLLALIAESEEKILKVWDDATSEAQANETAAKFNLGFTIQLDLDADKMTTALSFSVKHKLSTEQSIPDPDQPNLPGVDAGSVTFSSGGTSVTIGPEEAKLISKAAKRLREKMN